MGVTAATMQVTHTLKVVTEVNVAAVIRHGDVHSLVCRHIDLPLQAKNLALPASGPSAKGSGLRPIEGGLSVLDPWDWGTEGCWWV